MLKREFIEKTQQMVQPSIKEFDPDDNYGHIGVCWVIEDKADLSRKFCTPAIKLSQPEYMKRDLSPFYKRVGAARKKYHRWFTEATRPGTAGAEGKDSQPRQHIIKRTAL